MKIKFVLTALLFSTFCFAEDFETVKGKTQSEENFFADKNITKFYLWEIYEVKKFPEKFSFTICDNRGAVIMKGEADLSSGKYHASDTLGKTVPKDQFKLQDVFDEKDKTRFIRISIDALLFKNSNTTLQISSSDE